MPWLCTFEAVDVTLLPDETAHNGQAESGLRDDMRSAVQNRNNRYSVTIEGSIHHVGEGEPPYSYSVIGEFGLTIEFDATEKVLDESVFAYEQDPPFNQPMCLLVEMGASTPPLVIGSVTQTITPTDPFGASGIYDVIVDGLSINAGNAFYLTPSGQMRAAFTFGLDLSGWGSPASPSSCYFVVEDPPANDAGNLRIHSLSRDNGVLSWRSQISAHAFEFDTDFTGTCTVEVTPVSVLPWDGTWKPDTGACLRNPIR